MRERDIYKRRESERRKRREKGGTLARVLCAALLRSPVPLPLPFLTSSSLIVLSPLLPPLLSHLSPLPSPVSSPPHDQHSITSGVGKLRGARRGYACATILAVEGVLSNYSLCNGGDVIGLSRPLLRDHARTASCRMCYFCVSFVILAQYKTGLCSRDNLGVLSRPLHSSLLCVHTKNVFSIECVLGTLLASYHVPSSTKNQPTSS